MAISRARLAWQVLPLVPVLAVSACVASPSHVSSGAISSGPTTTPPSASSLASPPDDTSDSTWNPLTARLGETAAFDSGLGVRISGPTGITATSHTVGTRPHQINLRFVVTLDNGQSDPLDLRPLQLTASTGPTQAACQPIHDDAARWWVRTATPLPPGGRNTFTVAFSCPGAKGQPLVVAITPREGFADLEFTGLLP
jgi:hypothetical protein